ncbi:unnamed protein product [Litomosoides sigmodontis]|uniref:FHA domain-containing protein n=1 Tax=Litomosoides sigmodontis TaxID=42156 RepID=A0A3P6TQ32_LITSI|nr:unnamed protein product [Litomosoides sigmodontis]
MTRKRRNNSPSCSEKSYSSGTRRSTSPGTSRSHLSRRHQAHSSSSYDKLENQCRDSGDRRHAESRKDYSRHHRTHRSNDSVNSGKRHNELSQNDNKKNERSHTKERVEGDRGIKKEFDEESNGKLSTRNTKEERLKSRSHPDQFGKYLCGDHDKKEEPKIEKEKPNFEPSGKLAEDTNTYRGVVIKYNEPSDAHLPKLRWRLYPFKGDEALPVLYIHRQSAYLIGRDRKIADLPVDHPSCSKQHAVFQYRLTPKDLPDGTTVKRIRPYIIDLGSANGTYLNNERIESQRFIELREKDVLKFGFSTREFVLLNEKSHDGEDVETVKKEEVSPS